ncbi:hypothetical protein GC163_16750 [bacterium]|nr:hypothetical protein [bacterium]
MSEPWESEESTSDPPSPGDVETGELRLQVTDFEPEEPYYSFDSLPPFPHPLKHPLKAIGWITSLCFGLASLVLLLAVIAAIPIVNFVALGYLLEAQGRVARTGKLTYALPLLPLAPRLGGMAFGTWFWLLIVRFVADAASDARTISPESAAARGWNAFLTLLSTAVAAHLILALARGGSFWCYFRPIKNLRWMWQQWRADGYLQNAATAVRDFTRALKIPHHFRLGAVGFLGTFAWLFVPTMLFGFLRDVDKPGQVIVTLMGAAILMPVLAWIPFLQAHYAAEQRWRAFLDWKFVRKLGARAPVGWFLTTVLLYALALPLYLFKIAAPPQDAMWFVTLIFVTTIYPAKILIGWAYAKARQRETQARWFWRWPCRLLLVPLLGIYLFLLFFTPAIGSAGRRVLFEHHALLLPTPF